jgi:AcrR family transcriptional regulator
MGQRAETRERVLRAAVETLATEGYAGTTARAIARTGGFAPGVIYYYFDDQEDLFLATAQYTSERRLARYRSEIDGVTSATELVRRLRDLYAEDAAEGHIAAVQELIAGASSSSRLGAQLRTHVQLWEGFAEEVAQRFLTGTPFDQLIPVREIAVGTVAFYLGLEMLTHLDGDRSRPDVLFGSAERMAALFDAFRPSPRQ